MQVDPWRGDMASVASPMPGQAPGRFDASDRAIRRAVGFAPEFSSANAGWNSVALYGWRGQCGNADFEPFAEPVVIYHVGGAQTVPVRVGRRLDRTHPGMITVIPPSTRVGWDIRGEVHSRSVHLGARLFENDPARPVTLDGLAFRCGIPDPLLVSAIHSLENELRDPSQHGPLYADAVSTFMAAHLLRDSTVWAPTPRGGRLSRRVLERVLERIEASIEIGVSLQALADESGLSRAYFASAFRQATGLSPHRYLTQRRLLRARELLHEPGLSIAHVALRCGFSSQAHFTEYFRREAGATPSEFRRRVA